MAYESRWASLFMATSYLLGFFFDTMWRGSWSSCCLECCVSAIGLCLRDSVILCHVDWWGVTLSDKIFHLSGYSFEDYTECVNSFVSFANTDSLQSGQVSTPWTGLFGMTKNWIIFLHIDLGSCLTPLPKCFSKITLPRRFHLLTAEW